MFRRTALRSLVFVVAFCGAVPRPARAEGDRRGNLTGTWRLNHDLSDNPERMREGGPAGGTRGGQGGFGRRRGGGFGGHRGRREEVDDGAPPALDPEALEKLTIVHRDPEFRITDGLGRQHVLFTDGRKVEEERSAGTVKIRTDWKDGHVVVTTTPKRGPRITEAYGVAADGSVLTVTTRVQGRGPSLELRRVYDAVR
ncbi:MAG TPA: hypothetical protein VK392_08350 [Thermoanaerobaculia bacterium]|nr:hypothetical protein [Thermoanaerobaculia bacterium]